MKRQDLLNDIKAIIEGMGYQHKRSGNERGTYRREVKYNCLIPDTQMTAHFIMYTHVGSIQIAARYQRVSGTAIEKLGMSVLDAGSTEHAHYIVVCGGNQLVPRAIEFLNNQQHLAPKLEAMEIDALEDHLEQVLNQDAA